MWQLECLFRCFWFVSLSSLGTVPRHVCSEMLTRSQLFKSDWLLWHDCLICSLGCYIFPPIHLHKCAFAYSVSSGFSKRRLNCNLGLVFLKLLILLWMKFLAVVVQLPLYKCETGKIAFFQRGKKTHWHLTKTENPFPLFLILVFKFWFHSELSQ